MHLPRLSLGKKLPMFFLMIAVIPLVVLNLIWLSAFRGQFAELTGQEISHVSQGTASYITNYLSSKFLSLIIHSQTDAVLTENTTQMATEMQNFLLQDKDIQEIQVLNKAGKEIFHLNRQKVYQQNELIDQSQNPAYKITTFVGGNRYTSPVQYEEGKPYLKIAVPIVSPKFSRSLQDLNTSSLGIPRQSGEIFGIVIEKVSLDNLWNYISEVHVGKSGYVFIVDEEGKVLSHPNHSFVSQQKSLMTVSVVKEYIATSLSDEDNHIDDVIFAKNEYSQDAYMQHRHLPIVSWGLIAEEPTADIISQLLNTTLITLLLFLVITIIVILVSLSISSRITAPIKVLQKGSQYIGSGNLDSTLSVNTGDELEDLAKSFNTMSGNLKQAFNRLNNDKDIIAAEQNKIAATLASIDDIVIVIDLKKHIIIFNKAAELLLGVQAKEVMGKTITEVMSLFQKTEKNMYEPISDEIYAPLLKEAHEGIVFKEANLKLIGSTKKEVQVNVTVGQIKEGMNIDVGAIITIHDITKERELEDMKLDFVSMAAHELRTPLTAIRGYLSILQGEISPMLNDHQKTFFTRMQHSSDHLMALVENILNVSKIERGALKLETKAVDLDKCINYVLDELKFRAGEKRITLSYTKALEKSVTALADEFRISQVLTNLLANAVNYTPAGGNVTIWTERINREIITHIKDNGEGIPKEAIPHLFTKFFRVSGKLEQGSKGTGLGLYITKSIVESHKGRIWVTSEVGKGSTFSFSVPVYE